MLASGFASLTSAMSGMSLIRSPMAALLPKAQLLGILGQGHLAQILLANIQIRMNIFIGFEIHSELNLNSIISI